MTWGTIGDPVPGATRAGRSRRWRHRSVAALTEELLAIDRERGFLVSGGGVADKRTKRIGRALNRSGGMELMQEVHTNVSRQVTRSGASRSLDVAWDGIGDRLG